MLFRRRHIGADTVLSAHGLCRCRFERRHRPLLLCRNALCGGSLRRFTAFRRHISPRYALLCRFLLWISGGSGNFRRRIYPRAAVAAGAFCALRHNAALFAQAAFFRRGFLGGI